LQQIFARSLVSPKRKTNQRVLRRRNGKIADRCYAVSLRKGDGKMVLELKSKSRRLRRVFSTYYVAVDSAQI
jgi:hypothetical protein